MEGTLLCSGSAELHLAIIPWVFIKNRKENVLQVKTRTGKCILYIVIRMHGGLEKREGMKNEVHEFTEKLFPCNIFPCTPLLFQVFFQTFSLRKEISSLRSRV